MKRVVIAASKKADIGELIDAIPDIELGKMSKAEKRIIAKAKNSPNPQIYLAGAADAIELVGADVTDAFVNFYNTVLQNWDFNNSQAGSIENPDGLKGYPIMYDKRTDTYYANFDGHVIRRTEMEELAAILNTLNKHPEKLHQYSSM